MTGWPGIVLALLAQSIVAAATDSDAIEFNADTLVVCPAPLREALAPWVAHRRAQGRELVFCDQIESPERIRAMIRQVASHGRLRWIVLVGDVPDPSESDETNRGRVPAFYQKARVISRWGPDRDIVSDNGFADLDDDGLPDLAIGRLSAHSPTELAVIVRKILAFEQAEPRGDWRKRISFVAGVGGFGTVADGAIEMTTRKFLTELIPPAYSTSMTYGSWQSPFCPDPRRFHEAALDRLNEGSLFWVYLGHGQRTALDRVQVPGHSYHIMSVQDVGKLNCREGQPIAVMLACYTGAFDANRACLAEEMLRAPGGPVATICGSRMTMPYAMAVIGNGMLHEYFVERSPTLGELVLAAKRDSLREEFAVGDPRQPIRGVLDAMASLLMPGATRETLRAERLEHVALFHILGDPLLTLRHPGVINVEVASTADAGKDLPITVRSPLVGECEIELLCRRDGRKTPFAGRHRFDPSDASLEAYHADYIEANDACWRSWRHVSTKADFATSIAIPADAWGPCIVRVHVQGESEDALGACEVLINR